MAFSSGEIRASFILDSRGPSGLMRGKHLATNSAIQSGMTVVDTTSREIHKLRRAIARGTIAAVTSESGRVFALSQDLVPVDSGSLQRSGKVKVHLPGDLERKLPYESLIGARRDRQHQVDKVKHVANIGNPRGTPLYAMNKPSPLNIPAETGKSRGAQANISYGSGTPDTYTGKVVRYAIPVHQGVSISSRKILTGIGTSKDPYRERIVHKPYSKYQGFSLDDSSDYANLPVGRGPRFLDRAIMAHRATGLPEYAKIVWSHVKESLVSTGDGGGVIPFGPRVGGVGVKPDVVPF